MALWCHFLLDPSTKIKYICLSYQARGLQTIMKLLRRAELRAKVGLSDTAVDTKEARGDFPKRVPLGPRAVGWVEAEIDQRIVDRAAERGSQPAPSIDK
jgi:prophage regulatory protein